MTSTLFSKKEIITELTKESFTYNLQTNPGVFIIKFGAEWCGPCKKIEAQVLERMEALSDKAKCAIIDIDDNFEIYAALKSRRMVNGIPVILCYKKGNVSYIPDDIVVGAESKQIYTFFNRCEGHIAALI